MKKFYNYIINSKDPIETTRKFVAPICKEKLKQSILECNKCKNNFDKKICIGNPDADIFIIDDSLDNYESKDSYSNIIHYLKLCDIDLNNVFIINCVNCICKRKTKDKEVFCIPSDTYLRNCKEYVDYAIKFVNPKVILCIGAAVNQYQPNTPINNDTVEKVYNFYNKPTFIIYSPSEVLKLKKYSEAESIKKHNQIVKTLKRIKKYLELVTDKH